jgi:hypothetical protein
MVIKMKIIIFSLCFFQLPLVAYQQEDAINKLRDQFEQFSKRGLTEKLYVHTDKDFYTEGEIIWFKVYAVDGIFNKPLDVSKAAYIEILGADHIPVLQGKILMDQGSGSGSFTIPASVRSGNYLLRAYTNWMKNNSLNFFFEKTVTVVNSLKKPDWTSIQNKVESYDVQFLPEGGNLIYGIESRIAFKAVNKNGKGISCRGFILDQKNDTVSHFKTLRFGMGRFSFLPLEGKEYSAYIQLENETVLPVKFLKARSTGYVMKCEDHSDQLLITVTAKDSSSNNSYLLIHKRQVIKTIKAAKISNGKSEFTIDKNILAEGISDIIIFNDQLKPVCERLYFKRPEQQLEVVLNADKQEYAKRNLVNLQLQTTDQFKKPVKADLSLSVYLIDSVQSYQEENIRSYLWLSSELSGNIEEPDYYFSSADPEAAEAADNLMMTQGWRRFNWEDIEEKKNFIPEFIPESDGTYVSGKIIDKRSGLPVAGVLAYLSVPGQHSFVTAAISSTDGTVKFNINNVYGYNPIVIQPADQGDSSNYRIEVNSPFISQYSERVTPVFSIPGHLIKQLQTHSLSSQVQNAFLNKEQQQYLIPTFIDSTAFFGKPDKKYFLDNYTRFTTMEEVMREYVPEVRLRKKDGQFHYMVKNLPYLTFFEQDPLILLDGIPIFKADEIISFDPLKIKKMEIVTHTFYTASGVHSGIVSYVTYDENSAGIKLPSNAIATDYPGFLYDRSFYSPVYRTQQELENRLPDFRNVLHWEPGIKTDDVGKHSISFYTSDLPGRYIIVAEGISKEGLSGTVSAFITVKK